MKTFGVYVPFTGQLYLEVQAEDEDSAIEAALVADLDNDMQESWEALRCVCEGNVFHGTLNTAYAVVVDEGE